MNSRQRWGLVTAFLIVVTYVVWGFNGKGPTIDAAKEEEPLSQKEIMQDRFPLYYDFDHFIGLISDVDTLERKIRASTDIELLTYAEEIDGLLLKIQHEQKKFSTFSWEIKALMHQCSVRQARALRYYQHVLQRSKERLYKIKRLIPCA